MQAISLNSVGVRNETAPADLNNLKILVADDNADMRNLFLIILEQAGAKVKFAKDGFEVVKLAKREHFDAIVMDLAMPNLNGEEATKVIKSLGITIPVIATSGFINRNEFLAKGFDGVLPKPFELNAVVRVIKNCIAKKNG